MVGQKFGVQRLTREYAGIQKSESSLPNIATKPSNKNIFVWYFVLYNLDNDSYRGGLYMGVITFPTEYPLKPPSVKMITPNGRFSTSENICMSMTNFHPESWNPTWRVETLLVGTLSFFLEDEYGSGTLPYSPKQRQFLALKSFEFNSTNEVFKEHFPEFLVAGNFNYSHLTGYTYLDKGTPRTEASTKITGADYKNEEPTKSESPRGRSCRPN